MQKRMKTIALLLITAMAATACGQKGSPSTSAEPSKATESSTPAVEEIENFNAEGYPICDEPVVIKIFGRTTGSEFDLNQNPAWQYMEKLFNVDFEFEVYSSGADAKQNGILMMSDPKNPNNADILWNVGFDMSDWMSYAENGHILQLDEYIDKYAPNIQACFDSNPQYKNWAKSTDGNIYGLPVYLDQWYMEPAVLYINDKWMANVGITEYPTTIEELKEVLIAFRDNDANGNGDPTDEIPMRGHTNLNTWITSAFMDAVGLPGGYPYTGMMYYSPQDQPGTLLFQPTTEEYRYAVEYMASLYDEGLLESDFFTATGDIRTNRMYQDQYGLTYTAIAGRVIEKHNPDDWTALKPLRSVYTTDADYICLEPSYYDYMGAINAYTKYPEVCVRILDFLMSPDGSALFLGKSSAEIDFVAAGVSEEVIAIIDEAQAMIDAGDQRALRTIIGGNFASNWFSQFDDHLIQINLSTNALKTKYENLKEYKDADKIIYNVSNKMIFNSEENEIVAAYKGDVHSYVRQKLTDWVSGSEKLTDDTWNAYLKKLEEMNIEELNKCYQNAYTRWLGQ